MNGSCWGKQSRFAHIVIVFKFVHHKVSYILGKDDVRTICSTKLSGTKKCRPTYKDVSSVCMYIFIVVVSQFLFRHRTRG